MHIPESGRSDLMTDVAAARLPPWPLRVMARRHTAKWTARRFGRAIETARKWLVDGVPGEQRAAMADVIDAELDRIEEEVTALRAYRDWCRDRRRR
jgi:hypothetical protein